MAISRGNPFRTWDGFHKWKDAQEEELSVSDVAIASALQEAWDGGSTEARERVLTFIIMSRPPESLDYIWKGIHSRSRRTIDTAFIALRVYVKETSAHLTASEITELRQLLLKAKSATVVASGLEVLELLEAPELDELLEAIATGAESAAARFEANYRLFRRGRSDVVSRLTEDLEDIQPHFEKEFALERLLWPRVRVLLSPESLAKFQGLAAIEMDNLRARASDSDPWHAGAAISLVRIWVQGGGMPYQSGDIDLVAAAAASEELQSEERLQAVTLLGWFDEPEATEWLRKLSAPQYPQQLRRAARKFVKTREVRLGH